MHDQPTPSPDDDRLRDEEADDAFPRIASLRQIAEHYGPNVSAILRNDDFPTEPSSYFVQSQTVTSRGATPWVKHAVYTVREGAERYARMIERATAVRPNPEGGPPIPTPSQPVAVARVVTLEDLIRAGSRVVGQAIFDLATSDHEWIISTEMGDEQTVALMGEMIRKQDEESDEDDDA